MWYLLIGALLTGVLGLTLEECDTIVGSEAEYQCSYGDSMITFAGKNNYVKVYCEGNNNVTCSDLPRFNYARGLPLRSIGIWSCPTNLLQCMYDVLNATSIEYITLTKMTSPLMAEDVRRLEAVTMLIMTQAGSQKFMPIEAINSLPNLKNLRIGGGNLQLSPHMFLEAPPLEYLELHSNNIESIPVDTFMGFQSLKVLNVWGNNILNVSVGAFNGLNNLRALTLNTNKLKYIEPGAFASTPKLGSLQLVGNQITSVPNKLLEGLNQLENVTIIMNQVSLQLDNFTFANLSNLKMINLKDNKINTLPGQVFRNSTNIERLNLSKNSLAKLTSSLFLRLSKLKYIDLSYNQLFELSEDVFFGLHKLEYLNLNSNHIEKLPADLFSSQNKLKELYIDHNFITTIAWTCFQGASNLETLSLAYNKLTLESEEPMYNFFSNYSPFQFATKLKKLNLSGNKIRTIFDDWRYVFVQMEYLDLSWNQLTEVFTQLMDFNSASITVDLRHNNISNVVLSPFLSPESDSNPKRVLLLDENPIICDCFLYGLKLRTNSYTPKGELKLVIDNTRCASPPNLKGELIKQVSVNDLLCDIQEDCPNNCTCDAKIVTNEFLMSCYELPSRIPDMDSSNFRFYFTEIPTLNINLKRQPNSIQNYIIHTLNLSNANIETIEFKPSQSLKVLDLSHNKLNTIPVNFIESDVTLYLANNSFQCECWYSDSLSILKNYDSIPDFDFITCSDGEFISTIDVAGLCSTMKATVTAICIFAVLAFLFLASMLLIYRYYNEIMLYLSTRCFKGLITTIKKDADKEYDVFISFAHKDFSFIEEVLLPKLENEFSQKVCVHYRDWNVGELIPTQIIRSVENSRRTIIIMSKSFLESDWANMEFSAAHNLALQERQTRVILILLNENITKHEKISPELRAYINLNTYLVWGDPKFWPRLEKALPKIKHRFKFMEALKRQSDTDKSSETGLNVQLNSEGKLINCSIRKSESSIKLQEVP